MKESDSENRNELMKNFIDLKNKPDQRSQKKKASKNEKEIKPLQNSK